MEIMQKMISESNMFIKKLFTQPHNYVQFDKKSKWIPLNVALLIGDDFSSDLNYFCLVWYAWCAEFFIQFKTKHDYF